MTSRLNTLKGYFETNSFSFGTSSPQYFDKNYAGKIIRVSGIVLDPSSNPLQLHIPANHIYEQVNNNEFIRTLLTQPNSPIGSQRQQISLQPPQPLTPDIFITTDRHTLCYYSHYFSSNLGDKNNFGGDKKRNIYVTLAIRLRAFRFLFFFLYSFSLTLCLV